ncbi:MAG TPA: PDZ domain-containing protein, partial [Tepidisphaeraceae bacterium]|nr:PDZ domain-containing protein [Tepidisphaeraceae bacterium]
DEQMKDFKIILPGDDEKELPAVFLGRDERCDLAFLKTKEKQTWPAIQFVDAPARIAEPVISIGLLPREAGYKPYYLEANIAAILRGPTPFALVSTNGLTGTGSPVFNSQGQAIGFVPFQPRPQLQSGNTPNAGEPSTLVLPPRLFVPARDFLPSLQEPPTGQPLRIPWFGAQLTGPSKEVAEYFNLKNTPVVQVGVIIPSTPASKAGLQPNDKIIKLNGQSLDRGDEPDETPRILMRKIRRMKVGQSVTLTILRAKDQPTTEVSVTLEEQPRQANLAKRFYADDLGLSVREAVFTDDYANRLPLDAKGVVVAYLRPGSSAATAALRPNDFIKELNSVPVEDLEHFKSQYQQFRRSNPKDVVVLVVLRDGITQVIKIEPPQ